MPTPPEIPSGPPAYLAAAIVRLGRAAVNGGLARFPPPQPASAEEQLPMATQTVQHGHIALPTAHT